MLKNKAIPKNKKYQCWHFSKDKSKLLREMEGNRWFPSTHIGQLGCWHPSLPPAICLRRYKKDPKTARDGVINTSGFACAKANWFLPPPNRLYLILNVVLSTALGTGTAYVKDKPTSLAGGLPPLGIPRSLSICLVPSFSLAATHGTQTDMLVGNHWE